jgi:aminoglycoside/choline kinase family phosphotransferase
VTETAFHTLDHIAALTRARFPEDVGEALRPEPLEKGGSDRKFYRLHGERGTKIFVQYGMQREENRHYVEIASFLKNAGVRGPEMFVHEPEAGLIWMEDLGEQDLWAYRAEAWEIRKRLYEAVLLEAVRLHGAAQRAAAEVAALGLQPPFDAALYQWEQDYFFNQCLIGHLRMAEDRLAPWRERLRLVAEELAALPRCLIHRDFQSQNIIIQNGAPCLIDFQGMRFGLPQYDLASLLLDPYVVLTEDERNALLSFYVNAATAAGAALSADFERTYLLCAAQRLMQALGAYGFLGHQKGRLHFLEFIPVALPRLLKIFGQLGALDGLVAEIEASYPAPAH